jgi:hypothetical protein
MGHMDREMREATTRRSARRGEIAATIGMMSARDLAAFADYLDRGGREPLTVWSETWNRNRSEWPGSRS